MYVSRSGMISSTALPPDCPPSTAEQISKRLYKRRRLFEPSQELVLQHPVDHLVVPVVLLHLSAAQSGFGHEAHSFGERAAAAVAGGHPHSGPRQPERPETVSDDG